MPIIPSFSLSNYNKVITTYKNTLVGDIAPYGDAELIKFIRSDLTASAIAKPQFISKVFFQPTISSSSSGITASFFNNTSYTTTNLQPWYDNYIDFFSNIKGYSQEHSVVPEFIVSNYSNIAESETTIENTTYYPTPYIKFNGREQVTQQSIDMYEDIKIDNFIDKKSNKVKFVFGGIKKLLPYNGFYPSQYSQVIAKKFADSYFSSSLTSLEKQALIQPIFGPGAFFNTIKAGLAMSYPTCVTSSVPPITTGSLYVQNDKGERLINTGSLNKKFTFDDLLDPSQFFREQQKYIYLDPTRYSEYFFDSYGEKISIPQFDGVKFIQNANGIRYRLAINNFLAETINFFLYNSSLTSFTSAPESEFSIPNGEDNYGLTIKISKNNNFSMFSKENLAGGVNKIREESLFGPPSAEFITDTSDRSVYARYSPVYYNSSDILEQNTIGLICKDLPSGSKPTVEDLLEHLYVYPPVGSPIKYDDYVKFFDGSNEDVGAMNIFLDSLLVKQKISAKQNVIDPITGEQITTTDTKNIYKWSIQTKFESPLVDYSDYNTYNLLNSATIAYTSSVPSSGSARYNLSDQSINGIWGIAGSIPKDGESIQIEISDEQFEDSSLLKLCGFKKETKSIGQLANQKEISEAVVVLPYCKSDTTSRMSKANSDEPNKWLIPIGVDKINKVLAVPDYTKLNINKIKNILDTSSKIDQSNQIIKLMKAMVKYNIPPHLNWLKDKTIKPFVMYIAEFSHVLDKQDLADIWQGQMPKIAKIPEEQQVIVEHSLDSDNFYDRAELDKYLSAGMYIKIFKVKQRGKIAYSEVTANAEDDAKFNTDFPDKWYSYNWPYDYFSLVELLNIKAGEVYENTGSV